MGTLLAAPLRTPLHCSFSREWLCKVKVMNWGYWRIGTGEAISEEMKIRLKQSGIGAIEPQEGMEALEKLLIGSMDQLIFFKTLKPQEMEKTNPNEWMTTYPETIPSVIRNLKKPFLEPKSKFKAIKLIKGPQYAEMEEFLFKLLLGNLQLLGLFKVKTSLSALYERWFQESINVLRTKGYLEHDGESDAVKNPFVDLEMLWKEWDQAKINWKQNTNLKHQVVLVEACLHALPKILTGRQQATDVIFPNSSMDLVEGIYKGNTVSDMFNEVLGTTVEAYFEKRFREDSKAQIRILEIGAGTGGTTAGLLTKLRLFQDNVQEYCYTDISKAFLFHAEEQYIPQNPYIRPQIFDVEKPIAGQNIRGNYYDLVIATNILHATKNIRRTLRNVKAPLRKKGIILLNEISRKSLFAHLTFGLLEGWWLNEDNRLRIPGSPGLYPETWQKILEEEGFHSVLFPAEEVNELGQQIIMAESNGIIRQEQPYQTDVDPAKKEVPLKIVLQQSSQQTHESIREEEITQELLRDKSTNYFKKLVGKTLRMENHQIDSSEPLGRYGIDSILIVQITNRLREVFNDVSSTLLFEVQTIDALAEHFIKTERDSLIRLLELDNKKMDEGSSGGNQIKVKQQPSIKGTMKNARRFRALIDPKSEKNSKLSKDPIAIVGISGRYAQADTLDAFWEHLKAGKDCITEIPPKRWSLDGFFHQDPQKAVAQGKSYSKWGSFLESFADFDPLFFNISPREAMSMDPQERLFLQSCWDALEDAGYTREHLATQFNRSVGVFAGITKTGFNLYGPELGKQKEGIDPHTSFSSVANRVSYFLNLHGPSMPIDTMCSSSLTAIHEACEYLRHGECELAIAGGVNLYLHPSTYVRLCAQRMLSRDGQCKSFGKGSNGFVPGEGVGVVILKRLSKAIIDQDHIHAVIRGTSVNHGGKTHGYTVPNPKAQGELIRETLEKAGINARAVSYMEAHGTGTELGDPIEVTGLTQAFQKDTLDTSFCALGSAKSNLGHLEAAAGIAGLTKIVLQMKNGQLVPSLHARKLNPNIPFEKTPFTCPTTA